MEVEQIEELFEPFGTVKVKKMFGGIGVFHRGLSFAGVMEGEFRMKADALTIPDFESEGMSEWAYSRKDGKVVKMGYWSVPERLWDDPEEFVVWAQKAFEAAVRFDQAKPAKQRKLV